MLAPQYGVINDCLARLTPLIESPAENLPEDTQDTQDQQFPRVREDEG